MVKVLVVVNPQNDFISGYFGHAWAENVAAKITKEIESIDYEYVFVVRDTHYHDYFEEALESKHIPHAHCIYQSWGWQIDEWIQKALQARDHHIVNSTAFGAIDLPPDIFDFLEARYGIELDPRNVEINICGFNLESAIVSNALLLRAFFPNSPINCIAGLCCERNRVSAERTLEVMEDCYIEIK